MAITINTETGFACRRPGDGLACRRLETTAKKTRSTARFGAVTELFYLPFTFIILLIFFEGIRRDRQTQKKLLFLLFKDVCRCEFNESGVAIPFFSYFRSHFARMFVSSAATINRMGSAAILRAWKGPRLCLLGRLSLCSESKGWKERVILGSISR